MELIRQLHIRTYDYLGEMKASTNPLAYCEGGFYGGHLGLYDKIKPLLKSATASFGITAFNELQQLHNKKSLVEDGAFALEVLEYINKKVNQFKKKMDIYMQSMEHRQRIFAACRCSSSVKNTVSSRTYQTENM